MILMVFQNCCPPQGAQVNSTVPRKHHLLRSCITGLEGTLVISFDVSGMGDPTRSYATAGIALRIT
jgi:hypothetical protein